MPDTILLWNGHKGYRVPGWYPHAGSIDEHSFTDAYTARLEEFRTMTREDLKAEVARLRDIVKHDGRPYVVSHHAQRYAAEDVYEMMYRSGRYDV